MKNKKLGLGMLGILVGATMLSAVTTFAYRGDMSVKGPNYSPERHALMTKAFETNDYTAWKNLMQNKGRVTQVVNETNFAKFAQMHKLLLEGKTAEADKIRQELGLGLHNGTGNKSGGRFGSTNR